MFFYRRYKKLDEEQCRKRVKDRRVHMANERTFLAWTRTAISVITLGFIVEKFSMFIMSQITDTKMGHYNDLEYTMIVGIALMLMGGFMGIIAIVRYVITERDIEEDRFQPAINMDLLFAIIFLTLVVLSLFYLVKGIHIYILD